MTMAPVSNLSDLLELWASMARDRELLQGLLWAAAQTAQALSGHRLREPPQSAFDVPAWLVEYDTAATAGNAPTYAQWFGWESPLPQEPSMPWAWIIAGYVRQREPGIAQALRDASAVYAAIERDGSAQLRALVNDRVIRRWASARLDRERGTGRGSGLGPRPLAPAGPSVTPLLLLGVAVAASARLDGSVAFAALAAGSVLLLTRSSGARAPAARALAGGSSSTARSVPRRRTGQATHAQWARSRLAVVRSILTAAGEREPERLARAVVAHWGLETGLGSSEDNFNLGNVGFYARANDPSPLYFVRGGRRWRAYPSLDRAARDYLDIVRGSRYSPAWEALRNGASAGEYAALLVSLGYTEPTSAAERIGRSVESVANTLDRIVGT